MRLSLALLMRLASYAWLGERLGDDLRMRLLAEVFDGTMRAVPEF